MPFIDFKPPKDHEQCRDPEHNPHSHIVLPPGTHTYQYPSCGKTVTFTVRSHSLSAGSEGYKWGGEPECWQMPEQIGRAGR
jgi:hypothetical protein